MKITWSLGSVDSDSLQDLYNKLSKENKEHISNKLTSVQAEMVHLFINNLDTSYQQKIEILDTYKASLVN